MNCISWYGSKEFCKWVGGRLATEQEWYAEASAGGIREYPWGGTEASCKYIVMNEGGIGCGKGHSWPVCSKKAGNSVSGLCDMSGNVWEWTSTAKDTRRVICGGSYSYDIGSELRTSGRNKIDPDYMVDNLGFRCVRKSH